MIDFNDPLSAFEAELLEQEQRNRWSTQLLHWSLRQRIDALYSGRMNGQQFAEWQALAPDEIPDAETRRAEWTRRLWAMTRQQRVEAMYERRLTLGQLLEWSRKRPHEVPRIGGSLTSGADRYFPGEFAWIVWQTPEWLETVEGLPTERELALSCEHTGQPVLDCDCPHCLERRAHAIERLQAEGLL
jgi:hypothetical protein